MNEDRFLQQIYLTSFNLALDLSPPPKIRIYYSKEDITCLDKHNCSDCRYFNLLEFFTSTLKIPCIECLHRNIDIFLGSYSYTCKFT